MSIDPQRFEALVHQVRTMRAVLLDKGVATEVELDAPTAEFQFLADFIAPYFPKEEPGEP